MDIPENQLVDIILPPAPPVALDYNSLLVAAIIFSLIGIIITYRAYQSGLKYKILIVLLKNKLSSSVITPRQAAYKLAKILQTAHNTNHLATITTSITSTQQNEWLNFIKKLSDYRYGEQDISQTEVMTLLTEAISWTPRVSR